MSVAKAAAAKTAIDHLIQQDVLKQRQAAGRPYLLGVGSGSTIVYFIDYLAKWLSEGALPRPIIHCVPTGEQTARLLRERNIAVVPLHGDTVPLDLCVDGADEIDAACHLIKGGGACHLREKEVAVCSRAFWCIADTSKVSTHLAEKWQTGVPLEVSPFSANVVLKVLQHYPEYQHASIRVSASSASTIQREMVDHKEQISEKNWVRTDGGNVIIDAHFGRIDDPAALDRELKQIVGIFETGLFVNMASLLFIGTPDGNTNVLQNAKAQSLQPHLHALLPQ